MRLMLTDMFKECSGWYPNCQQLSWLQVKRYIVGQVFFFLTPVDETQDLDATTVNLEKLITYNSVRT